MERYFLRAMKLFARQTNIPDVAAMHMVLDRVRVDEWRHSVA